jgi:Protein of unknown function (DUF3179)
MNRCGVYGWVAAAAVLAGAVVSTQDAPKSLPYTAIHDPEFISAAEATFMNGADRLIGLVSGETAKAYPGAILSQHGLVEDQSPEGPIAITW